MYPHTHARPTRSRGCPAGWALVFAAAVAATPTAVAGPSPLRPVLWAEQTTPEAASGMSAEAGKREEVRVKLAWLANPVTFHYYLGAHAEGRTMKLTGYVPCQALKERAAEIAGKATTLPLVDEIKVYQEMGFLFPDRKPLDVLYREATEVLRQEFGDRGAQLTVMGRPDGQLTVSGAVMPMEEQLAVAECLRRVGGCSCVVSKLDAPDRAAVPYSLPLSPGGSGVRNPFNNPSSLPPPRSGEGERKVFPLSLQGRGQGEGLLKQPLKSEGAASAVAHPKEAIPLPRQPRPASVRPPQPPSGVSVAPPAPKWEPIPMPVTPIVPAVSPPPLRSSRVEGPSSQSVATKSVPAPMNSAGYVSVGMISFENELSAPAANIEPSMSSPEQVQRAFLAAGGAALRRVRIQPLAGGKFDLDVTLSNADGWEQVLQRLKTLPELNGLQVNWNIALVP